MHSGSKTINDKTTNKKKLKNLRRGSPLDASLTMPLQRRSLRSYRVILAVY